MTIALIIGLIAGLYVGCIILTVNGFRQINDFIRKSSKAGR
jgi:hypothetical protein